MRGTRCVYPGCFAYRFRPNSRPRQLSLISKTHYIPNALQCPTALQACISDRACSAFAACQRHCPRDKTRCLTQCALAYGFIPSRRSLRLIKTLVDCSDHLCTEKFPNPQKCDLNSTTFHLFSDVVKACHGATDTRYRETSVRIAFSVFFQQ